MELYSSLISKKTYFALLSILLSIGLASCNKADPEDGYKVKYIERHIRQGHDHRAIFTWDNYNQLLAELSKEKYIVLPVHEFIDSINDSKVVICLRHDVDVHIFKAIEMAEMEMLHGIRSTYFILGTAFYYGEFRYGIMYRNKCMEEYYLKLYNLGHEIGIHNDLISVMIEFGCDPKEFNQSEISFYNSLGIPIYGNVAHGSEIASQTLANYTIFSDFTDRTSITYNGVEYPVGIMSLAEAGYIYEANFINYNKYFADNGNFNNDFNFLISSLENSTPGDRIEILAHPVWWGKE
ncbi:MAG: hypothetical protein KA793_03350 [Bacteroidales bacterium]|nr:hypothetical protein [Bacteroidales bacterium]